VSTTWRDRIVFAAPATALGALALVGPIGEGPTLCPFALCTGMACPGCGMTRAASHLIRGDVGTAVGYHPLILLVAILSVGGWAWYLLARTGRTRPIPTLWLNTILAGIGLMLLGVWVARALSGTLPPV
jgi:hypothetical protein